MHSGGTSILGVYPQVSGSPHQCAGRTSSSRNLLLESSACSAAQLAAAGGRFMLNDSRNDVSDKWQKEKNNFLSFLPVFHMFPSNPMIYNIFIINIYIIMIMILV